MPAASAVRTASAVGADTATMSGAPIAAVFCTNLDRNPAGQQYDALGGGNFGERQRAGELVERVVAADILAQATMPCAGVQNAAACTARV